MWRQVLGKFRDTKTILKETLAVKALPREIEGPFHVHRVETRAVFIAIAGLIAALTYVIFYIVNVLGLRDTSHSSASWISRNLMSCVFLVLSLTLLLKPLETKKKNQITLLLLYCLVFQISLGALFKFPETVGYDSAAMSSTLIGVAGACRLSKLDAIRWLVVGIATFIFVDLFLRGILGPANPSTLSSQAPFPRNFNPLAYVQIINAGIFAYLVVLVIEVKDRATFLREWQLVKSNEAKMHLLQGIGHDLRQPMTALMLHSDFARVKAERNDVKGMSESLDVIDTNLKLMNAELYQITELAADGDTSAPAEIEAVLIGEVLRSLHRSFSPRAEKYSIEFDCVVDKDAEGKFVASNDLLLRRVLTNLLNNAFKFTESKAADFPKKITLSASLDAGVWTISLQDSGIGISQKALAKIWDPFFQAANPERNSEKGFGLGLAHVKSTMARLKDHEISVQSVEDVGTTFTLRLIESSGTALQTASASPKNLQIDETLLSGVLIFILEDDRTLVTSLSYAVELWGGKTVIASTIAEGKQRLEALEISPDIALVDYRLPDGLGTSFKDTLVNRFGDREVGGPAIIYLTGEHVSLLGDMQGGQTSLVRKPVDMGRLKEELLKVLKSNKSFESIYEKDQ